MAIPLMALPIIAQAGMGLYNTIQGRSESRKAQNAFENAAPPSLLDSKAYQTAQTTQNLTGRWAQTGLPEQSMRFQQDMIGRSGAASLASAGSLRQGVAGLGGTAQSLGDQYRSLAAMDANQRIQNRQQYLGARQNVQNIEMQQGERDYGQFLNQQAMRLGQMTAGRQMQGQGMQQMTNAGGMLFQGALTPKAFGGLAGGGQGQQGGQGGQGVGSMFSNFLSGGGNQATPQSTPQTGVTSNNIRFGNVPGAMNQLNTNYSPFGQFGFMANNMFQ